MAFRKIPYPTQDDRELMHFIWKWKIASTAAITTRFMDSRRWAPYTVYWRLSSLLRGKWVELERDPINDGMVWTLSAAGFKVIAQELPALVQNGYATENVKHDLLCMAAHLGDFLPHAKNSNCEIVSEQELRRIHPDCLPEWVPPPKRHRPDGYWAIESEKLKRIIALEVELSLKTLSDYERSAFFYANSRSIESVLWIIANNAIGSRIFSSWPKGSERAVAINNFVMLDEFLNHGWNARISHGNHARKTISAFLANGNPHFLPTNAPLSAHASGIKTILDTRIRLSNSTPCVDSPDSPGFCIDPKSALNHQKPHNTTDKEYPHDPR